MDKKNHLFYTKYFQKKIIEIFLKKLENSDFLNSEFLTNSKNQNNKHIKLFKKIICMKGYILNDETNIHLDNFVIKILHLLLYLVSYVSNKECIFCSKNYIDDIMAIVSIKKPSLIILINSFFQIPLKNIKEFFTIIKINTNTKDGTYSFDLNLMILDNIKLNLLKKSYYKYFEYIGIIYDKSSEQNISEYAETIASIYKFDNLKNFGLIHSVGEPKNPEHWCAIYINLNKNLFFFYNSLAKEKQLSKKLYSILNPLYNNNLMFITNNNRQQFKNNLCGIFATNFLFKMFEYDIENSLSNNNYLIDFFNREFNFEQNMDDFFDQKQNDFVRESKRESYPFKILWNS